MFTQSIPTSLELPHNIAGDNHSSERVLVERAPTYTPAFYDCLKAG